MSNTKVLIFAIYSVLFECVVWGVFGYAVFWQGHSGWWILVALFISSSQLKPKAFGIGINKRNVQQAEATHNNITVFDKLL